MKKISLFFTSLLCISLITGCRKITFTEEEAFKYAEDIISEQEITVNFAHKDREMNDMDNYGFLLRFESEWGTEMVNGMNYSPENKKLGFKVMTNGNEWSIGNLYYPQQVPLVFGPENLKPGNHNKETQRLQEIYNNASWKLEPIRDEFHFWIEDYAIEYHNSSRSKPQEEPAELFYIVDENSDTRFTVSLLEIGPIILSEPKVLY